MLKNIFMVALFCIVFTGMARAEGKPVYLMGAGALISTSPYHGVGNRITPVPFVLWGKGPFYMRGIESGYKFYDHAPVTLKIFLSPHLMGYKASDADVLSGMHDRRLSLNGGVGLDWVLPYGEGVTLSLKAANDLLGRYDGRVGEATLSKKFKNRYVEVTPSLGVKVLSSQLTDYYYGVEPDEARADRPAYHPGSAVNYMAGVMFNAGLSKDWIIITRFGAEALDTCIRTSPLVGKDVVLSGMIGLTRRF